MNPVIENLKKFRQQLLEKRDPLGLDLQKAIDAMIQIEAKNTTEAEFQNRSKLKEGDYRVARKFHDFFPVYTQMNEQESIVTGVNPPGYEYYLQRYVEPYTLFWIFKLKDGWQTECTTHSLEWAEKWAANHKVPIIDL